MIFDCDPSWHEPGCKVEAEFDEDDAGLMLVLNIEVTGSKDALDTGDVMYGPGSAVVRIEKVTASVMLRQAQAEQLAHAILAEAGR